MYDYANTKIVRWRTGTTEGQIAALLILVTIVTLMLVGSIWAYEMVPQAAFLPPVVLGYLMLRYRPLLILMVFTLAAVLVSVGLEGFTSLRIYTYAMVVLVALILLWDARRSNSGLPGPLGEAMLVDLRDRLQAQSSIPELPDTWKARSAMKTAGGVNFAGDFLVAITSDDRRRLEMVLVDVCGKGVAAGTQSLHFAGALGGLLGALPPGDLFRAANQFLLRQEWEEGFATAAHVVVDLETGDYTVVSAGHPPALRWESAWTEWSIDGARGVALGVLPDPEFEMSKGTMHDGDALMFYTDGVIEGHSHDHDESIEWLVRESTDVVRRSGFDDLAKRVLAKVNRGDDDRAVLVLTRGGTSPQ